MIESVSPDLLGQLLKRNQHNQKAISSFIKSTGRRFARKMNTRMTQSNAEIPLQSPPSLSACAQNPHYSQGMQSLTQKVEFRVSQCLQTPIQCVNKQRKFEMKSLLKLVRETRQEKLKYYNVHAKKNQQIYEGKMISRAPLHLKNIVFFGQGTYRMDYKRNTSMKCSLSSLPALNHEKNTSFLHNSMMRNA